ncbi:NAD dependent epimerase/dehydratase family protein [Leifsonia aquatica ATCC 14665]|uniref:NAD dependent epimerase/dehydratase family protein n=2 Tax=Leifsonia aquatica TaxID=144185 RepID=U2T811_LEIAQ|nr:NAD dependent epimerase/dehydratase family protein [Leifsonia aquatica ATCC 14665]
MVRTMEAAMAQFAITGGNGRIGRSIIPRLIGHGHQVRSIDITEAPDDATWEHVQASIADRDALAKAVKGAGTLIHLAGVASERPWNEIVEENIDGTRNALQAAYVAGVPRVMLASSIHAVGRAPASSARESRILPPRPDTYYGVSKVAMEALGSLYADQFGMAVVSARICTFAEHPEASRSLATWLSPGDATRLVEAVATLTEPGHRIVWGVSANRPAWFPLEEGEAIGYFPQDDAVAIAERSGAAIDLPDPEQPLGAPFGDERHPVGLRW